MTDQPAKVTHRPRRLLLFADTLAVGLSTVAGWLLLRFASTTAQSAIIVTTLLAALIGLITVAMLAWSGEYSKRLRISRLGDVGSLTRNLVVAVALGTLISYLTKGFFTGVTGPSRMALGTSVLLLWVLGVIIRLSLSAHQRRLFARGIGVRSVMVMGLGPEADRVIEFVRSRPWVGVTVAGLVGVDTPHTGTACDQVDQAGAGAAGAAPHPELPLYRFSTDLQGLRSLDRTMKSAGVEELILALEPGESDKLIQVVSLLSLARVPFTIVPSLFEETVVAGRDSDFEGLRFLETAIDPPARLMRAVKRSVDVFISVIALLLLIPLGAPIALAILLESGRPIFYRQERLGRFGQPFTILKFRTMVNNAEALLNQLKSQDEGDGPHFKMERDPRLTRVGAFLRKWSLDELPQFWTVLRGDMSVVGPRPPLPREVAQYEASQLVRLKGKPGITGLWQVSGRKTLTFDDMVSLDRYYLEHWSLRMDLSIILRTFAAVFTRRGAY